MSPLAQTAAIETALCVLGTVLLIAMAAPTRRVRDVLAASCWRMATDPVFRRGALWMIGGMGVMALETRFDARLSSRLGWDLTPFVRSVEGTGALEFVQAALGAAVPVWTFVYVNLLDALVGCGIILLAALAPHRGFRRLSVVVTSTLAIALPFYLLAPVREAWHGAADRVLLLPDAVHPAIMDLYRSMSALDNCFPSLHAALAIVVTWAVFAGGFRFAGSVLAAASTAIVLSTLVLGIHWVTDLVGGFAAATAAILITRRIVRGSGATAASPRVTYESLLPLLEPRPDASDREPDSEAAAPRWLDHVAGPHAASGMSARIGDSGRP